MNTQHVTPEASGYDIDAIVASLAKVAKEGGVTLEDWNKNKEKVAKASIGRIYTEYQDNPVGFGEDVLGESYTEDVKGLMEAVRDYPIVISKSCNASGKTHAAARIAAWWYKSFENSQVYTGAAPPESNLKKLLWGEVGGLVEHHPELFSSDSVTSLHIERNAQSFLTGVTIPSSGTAAQREAKFCADANDCFEMTDGSVVKYGDLVGRKDIKVVSVDNEFNRKVSDAEFFDNGTKPVLKIKFDDGEVVRRTWNHPLYAGWDIRPDHHTHGGSHGKGRIRACKEGWVDAARLGVGHAVLCPDSTGYNFGLEGFDENKLKFLAYMIGDGCFRWKHSSPRLQFTQEDNAQLEEFLKIMGELSIKTTISNVPKYNWVGVSTNDSKLIDLVIQCGLDNKKSENKFIPDFIYCLSKELVSIFLNRLFSTDGWASLSNKAEIGYCSKSKRLVLGIQRLLLRFGIRAKVTPKHVTWKHNGDPRSGDYWNLSICHSVDVIRFADEIGIYGKEDSVLKCREYSSSRKWAYGNWKFEKPMYRWKRVVSVEAIGEKSTVGVHVPGDNTYLTSLVEHNSGKHAPYLLFIIDEGDAVPDEVYAGIESCMSGGHARLLIMFNPRAEAGKVYRMERDGQGHVVHLSAFGHPNVITGDDVIPGAVTQESVVRRINEWCRKAHDGISEANSFELPEFLDGAIAKSLRGIPYMPLQPGRYEIVEPAFSYMVLGQYPAQGSNQLISRDWINKARQRWDSYVNDHGQVGPAGAMAIMGIDVAEMGSDANVSCFRYGGFVPVMKTWGGVDVIATSERAVLEYREADVLQANVDATGLGAGVAPFMRRKECNAHGIKVAKSPTKETELGAFRIMRDQLWWECREWLRTYPGAMLPPDEMLCEELMTPTYEVKNGKLEVMRKDVMREFLLRSPDRADALCMTFADANVAFDPLDINKCAV